MKKLFISLIIGALCLGMALPVSAAPTVLVDGIQLSFDVPPLIEDGRTLVPLRAIFEALGAEVLWDGKTQTVTALAGATQIELTIGHSTAHINNQPHAIDVPATIINGRTLVPLRFVSEALGAKVKWDGSTQTISIATPNAGGDIVYDPFIFRNTTWGASVAQVKASEGNRPFIGLEDNESYRLSYENIQVDKYNCSLTYFFSDDCLFEADYYPDTSGLNKDNLLDYYYELEQLISLKYGPASFEPLWYDEQYIDDVHKWGYAVLKGHLDLESYWEYGDTLIMLSIWQYEDELLCMIGYGNEEFMKNQ